MPQGRESYKLADHLLYSQLVFNKLCPHHHHANTRYPFAGNILICSFDLDCCIQKFSNNLRNMLPKNDRRLKERQKFQMNFRNERDPNIFTNHRPATNPDRRPKRFLTSRQDQIDNLSACPSIEKELPELSIIPGDKKESTEQSALEEIIKECKLKDEALDKASSMINLLEEDNDYLRNYIEELEYVIKEKDVHIEILEKEICQAREAEADAITKEIGAQPKEKQYRNREIKSKSELFFEFTQSKDRNLNVHRSQNKIVNADHPTFKDLTYDASFSKKLSPYVSKHLIKDQTDGNQAGSVHNVLEQISLMIVKEEIDHGKLLVEDLNDMIESEEAEHEQFLEEFQRKQEEIEIAEREIFQIEESQTCNKRLFTLQNHSQSTMSAESIIRTYQQTIQDYKGYAAYLKAYLCECINYISNIFILPPPNSQRNDHSFLQLLKMIVKDIRQKLSNKLIILQSENEELKAIIEQLIKNIEVAHHRQADDSSRWEEECGLAMKELK